MLEEYQKTNINAIKEVNDALSNLQYDTQKYENVTKALKQEEKDFYLSKLQYNQGIISYLDLIQKREVLISTKKLKIRNF